MFPKHLACLAGALLIAASAAAAIDWNDPHSVVEAAITASPSLREIDANLAAARAQLRAAGALPNPMLMAGVQNQQIDLSRDPMMTMYTVGASQTFVRGERRDFHLPDGRLATREQGSARSEGSATLMA